MFSKVSRRQTFSFDVDVKDQLRKVVPEPDAAIVKRLISYYEGSNYAIRAPWQSSPTRAYYDLEVVKDFARILTLLQAMSIYPPAQVKTMGKYQVSGKKGNVPGNFEGPVQVTPSENASSRSFNVLNDEKEEKKNAMSSDAGSLVDGAEGQDVAIFGTSSGQRQVQYMIAEHEMGERTEVKDESEEVEFKMDDFDYFSGNTALLTRTIDPELMAAVSRTIDLRMPFADRLSDEKKQFITRLVVPRDTVDNALWFRNLGARRWARYDFIRKVAGLLLIPIILTPTFLASKNVNQTPEDELVVMFRSLPDDHWFKQLGVDVWKILVLKYHRPDSYLLFQRVAQGVIHFSKDVSMLWLIGKLLSEDSKYVEAWFFLLKETVRFRAENNDRLIEIVKNTRFFTTGYHWAYVLQSNPSKVEMIFKVVAIKTSFSAALFQECKNAETIIDEEYKTFQRREKFAKMFKLFEKQLILDTVPKIIINDPPGNVPEKFNEIIPDIPMEIPKKFFGPDILFVPLVVPQAIPVDEAKMKNILPMTVIGGAIALLVVANLANKKQKKN